MERPASIIRFEQFYLGHIALGLVATALNWSVTTSNAAVRDANAMIGSWYLPATIVFGLLIQLLLWHFAARRRSAVAKWALVVFFAIGLVGTAYSLLVGQLPMTIGSAIALVGLALYGMAVAKLFTAESKAWFGERPVDA